MTEVDICNQTLVRLRQKATITGTTLPSADSTPEARACNLFYAQARDELLQARKWTFATRQAQLLTLDAGAPPLPWGFAYTLPAGLLCVYSVANPVGCDFTPPPFIICLNAAGTARVMVTDQETPYIWYGFRQTDVTMFSPMFVSALTSHLGILVATYIGLAPDLVQALKKEDPLYISAAHAADAQESRYTFQPPESPLIVGRL